MPTAQVTNLRYRRERCAQVIDRLNISAIRTAGEQRAPGIYNEGKAIYLGGYLQCPNHKSPFSVVLSAQLKRK